MRMRASRPSAAAYAHSHHMATSERVLQQLQLIARLRRGPELRGIRAPVMLVEAEARAGEAEARAQELGIGAFALHAAAPARIVEAAAARALDQRQHVPGL